MKIFRYLLIAITPTLSSSAVISPTDFDAQLRQEYLSAKEAAHNDYEKCLQQGCMGNSIPTNCLDILEQARKSRVKKENLETELLVRAISVCQKSANYCASCIEQQQFLQEHNIKTELYIGPCTAIPEKALLFNVPSRQSYSDSYSIVALLERAVEESESNEYWHKRNTKLLEIAKQAKKKRKAAKDIEE